MTMIEAIAVAILFTIALLSFAFGCISVAANLALRRLEKQVGKGAVHSIRITLTCSKCGHVGAFAREQEIGDLVGK